MIRYPDEMTDEAVRRELDELLLESTVPVQPPASLRGKVLNRIRQSGPHDQFITVRKEQNWRVLIPGVEVKVLYVDESAGTKSFLLRAQAGVALPPHGHHADEECQVLEGSFSFGDVTLHAGDYHLARKGGMHPASTTQTGVLVYLRASIHDYPGV